MTTATLERLALQVGRDELLPALTAGHRVLDRGARTPILGYFLLRVAAGRMQVTATDLDLAIRIEVPVSAQADGAVVVPGATLREIVQKVSPDTTIHLEQQESGVTLKASRARFALPQLPAVDFPDLDAGEMNHCFEIEAEALERAFATVELAISRDETRHFLLGVFMHIADDELHFVASDGHRLARMKMPVPVGAEDMPDIIVPTATVAQIKRLAHDALGFVRLEVSPSKIRVSAGGTVITSKLIDGKYPDYTRVIPAPGDKVLAFDAEALSAGIERVCIVASDGRAPGVRLSWQADAVRLHVLNTDIGEAEETIDATLAGQPIEIGANGRYLASILGALGPGRTTIITSDAGSPMRIENPNRPDALFVLMPMRV